MSAAPQSMSATSLDRRIQMLRTAMGPLIAAALEDPDVVEIMLNPDRTLWVDRLSSGRAPIGVEMPEADGERIIRLVAAHVGAEVHRGQPLLSAELPETGERFEGILPPAAPGPAFALRKRAIGVIPLERYVIDQMMTAAQAGFLVRAVRERQNVLIAGATSSGKTTLANALLAEIAATGDRVLVLEDTVELQCAARDHVPLRTRAGVVSMTELVRSSMRLRPDRVVVGEVRGAEALDLIKVWGTGHPGGIAGGRLQRLLQAAGDIVALDLAHPGEWNAHMATHQRVEAAEEGDSVRPATGTAHGDMHRAGPRGRKALDRLVGVGGTARARLGHHQPARRGEHEGRRLGGLRTAGMHQHETGVAMQDAQGLDQAGAARIVEQGQRERRGCGRHTPNQAGHRLEDVGERAAAVEQLQQICALADPERSAQGSAALGLVQHQHALAAPGDAVGGEHGVVGGTTATRIQGHHLGRRTAEQPAQACRLVLASIEHGQAPPAASSMPASSPCRCQGEVLPCSRSARCSR